MKQSKTCSKCQSRDILKIEEDPTLRDSHNYIPVGSWLSIADIVFVPRYVCSRCGYAEEWIEPEDIPRLQKKYRKL